MNSISAAEINISVEQEVAPGYYTVDKSLPMDQSAQAEERFRPFSKCKANKILAVDLNNSYDT
jgi:hypothetical protein